MAYVRRRRRSQFVLGGIIPPPILGGQALVQTNSLQALVQTGGTLQALIQTGSAA